MDAIVKSPLKPNDEMPARVAAILPNFNAGSATSAARIEFTSPDRIVAAGAPAEAMCHHAIGPRRDRDSRQRIVSGRRRYLSRFHRRQRQPRASDAGDDWHPQSGPGADYFRSCAGRSVITSGGYALVRWTSNERRDREQMI